MKNYYKQKYQNYQSNYSNNSFQYLNIYEFVFFLKSQNRNENNNDGEEGDYDDDGVNLSAIPFLFEANKPENNTKTFVIIEYFD